MYLCAYLDKNFLAQLANAEAIIFKWIRNGLKYTDVFSIIPMDLVMQRDF